MALVPFGYCLGNSQLCKIFIDAGKKIPITIIKVTIWELAGTDSKPT